MAIAEIKWDPYSKQVWNTKKKLQEQQNAFDLRQIEQGNADALAAIRANEDMAKQSWANSQLAHETGVSNLTRDTQSQALQMQNARGSWANDYINGSPARTALEQNLNYAKQGYENTLSGIKTDTAQAAQAYADRLTAYDLALKNQVASDWEATHYWPGSGGGSYNPYGAFSPTTPTTPTSSIPSSVTNPLSYLYNPSNMGIAPTVQTSNRLQSAVSNKPSTSTYNPYASNYGQTTAVQVINPKKKPAPTNNFTTPNTYQKYIR